MAEQCLARSPRGVVAAAAPVAATVGAARLTDGGNAVDAAVAAALAEVVLLPPKCGLGGDLVALVWEPGAVAPEALLAIGGAPAGLADVADRMAATGPLSVGVPTAPLGYLALAGRGRLGIDTVAAPAIELAAGGFCWSSICTLLAEESRELVASHQPAGTRYFPGGEPIAPGAVTTLPGLAAALERLVVDGDQFLTGPVGEAIVARVRAAGGVLALDDLAAARASWTAPITAMHGAVAVHATPAPTHGASLLDALERLGDGGAPGAQYRAITSAIEQRKHSLADPSGTSMVSAVDGDGRLVTIVHSNSFPRFGSGLIVEEYDLILANRAGRGFTAEPGHPNFPHPGRRPATTLHAWGLATETWRVLGATPGGANQMPWNAQSLAALLADHRAGRLDERSFAEAVVGPRWQLDPDAGVTVEDGFAVAELADLADAIVTSAGSGTGESGDGSGEFGAGGGPVRTVERWALRSAMQIVGAAGDLRVGTADPRTVGLALPV